MHKVFISYHHDDQYYKERLRELNELNDTFIDVSVDTGDISDSLPDSSIRQKIRDEYLGNSTVTIVLVGVGTKHRKHVDWEIYSSMFDGVVNKKSGVLVVNLPSINCNYYRAGHGDEEKQLLYPEETSWTTINSRIEYESRYPYMPERVIDNLLENNGVKISVISWHKIENNFAALGFLIDVTSKDRDKCNYDLSRHMRRANS